MAVHYTKSVTIDAFTFTIDVEMRTGVRDIGEGKNIPTDTVTVTNYDGTTSVYPDKSDEEVVVFVAQQEQFQREGISDAPSPKVEKALLDNAYSKTII